MRNRREFLYAAGAALAPGGLQITDHQGEKLSVRHNGRMLLEYCYAVSRPKPYIHPLCLPGGRALTLDGPKDHIHHRGLMAAWSEVNGIDFWGEVNPARHGAIVHQKFERVREGPPGEIVAINHWIAEGKLLLSERRTIRIAPPEGDALWLEWISELSPASGPVLLAAGQHTYNGLGIRFIPEMDGGAVLNSSGASTIEKANGDPARWCAYHGAGATVAFFDHPSNPRHPNAFFVMNKDFGYMSAAPTFRQPFELAPGSSIRFHWGVLAEAGPPRAAALDSRFQSWTRWSK